MLLLASILFLAEVTDATKVSVPTYQHQDPITRGTLFCNRCPPGYHMHAHCTAINQTRCVPCKALHFTEFWNYLSKCLYCNNFCGENEFVKQECSALSNRVCECTDGFYRNQEFCMRHTKCPSGHGVELKGTAHRDTVCVKCSSTSYSPVNSAHEPCIDHTDCASLGLETVVAGTIWHNNICASCEDLNSRGGLDYLKEILPGFFTHQRMNPNKLQRFMNKLVLKNGDRAPEHSGHWDTSNVLQNHFREWLKEASKERLKELPEILRKVRLHNAADKLERKIKKVENGVYLCNIAT
ncbi:hypothetical protein AAFF_G00044360 [Aldrovandia affinis]|uniref:TNFR-Cys domain-containing protein n=1 Tax=Aldrovandia affinis TaxID=143900 RepID=A0AAD7WF92_9TELE|nr:hypothetical protein AAFF_G00044360 [Aldrovandia affinis]